MGNGLIGNGLRMNNMGPYAALFNTRTYRRPNTVRI